MKPSPTASAASMPSSTASSCASTRTAAQLLSAALPSRLPSFYAFDVLGVDGEDLGDRPLLARKRVMRRIMPHVTSRLLYVDTLKARGCDLFRAALHPQHDD